MDRGKRYRRIGSVLILPVLLLLGGCWDRIETNDIAFVLISSVDLEDDGQVRVSYLVPLPGQLGGSSGGGGGTSGTQSYYIDSDVGPTYLKATAKVQNRMSRKLILSHRRTLVIGEAMARRGISDLFDAVPRAPESRLTTYLVVAKGKGYDLLNTNPRFERFPAEAIRELTKGPRTMPQSTKDVAMALTFRSDPIMTYLEPVSSQIGLKKSTEVQFTGYAQFLHDRMIGVYREEEADGLMWLSNNTKQFLLDFPLKPGQDISVQITEGRTSIKPVVKDGQVSFNVEVEAVGIVREDESQQDLNEPKLLHKVEDKLAEQIKKSVQATLKQMQAKGTDSAHLGMIVWHKYPALWKQELEPRWRELFSQAEVHIKVRASISETGLINQNVTKDGDSN
ncbi:Ger(x)C family spore germination protein [Paenibacillus athensensis]|nr:Ger(x)C family spore germination protein [Paenibacillus athensensis]MCD1259570.1 Ger(x)C family spore germination protein [Paenibacillus athensensis]